MFKLDDLKTGDRVVLRDGRFMVVLKNTAVGNVISSFDGGSFMALGSYTQSLKVKRIDPREPEENDRDIVKVMRPCMPAHLLCRILQQRLRCMKKWCQRQPQSV